MHKKSFFFVLNQLKKKQIVGINFEKAREKNKTNRQR